MLETPLLAAENRERKQERNAVSVSAAAGENKSKLNPHPRAGERDALVLAH